MSRKTVVVASGYFNPIHPGHIEYLQKAKALGNTLVVIVNNDRQASLKTGFSFMSCKDRLEIVRALACVDVAVESIDEDRTVCKTLAMLRPDIFAKGGDQNAGTIPEAVVCKALDIQIIDGLGDKIQSARWLLKQMKKNLDGISDAYLNETA